MADLIVLALGLAALILGAIYQAMKTTPTQK